MQGRGVTNYSIDKPSHSYTTQTTQFDDALLSRNIITFEQAMMAKGASPEEAKRLAALKLQHEQEQNLAANSTACYNIDSSSSHHEKDKEGDDDAALLEEYRSKRLVQLQHGNIIPISRTDWSEQVNQSSHGQWVVVLLTSTSSAPNLTPDHKDICLKVESELVPELAGKFQEVKWLSIPSTSAIENWPDENLPTIFCYRSGELQCQLVGLGDFGNIVGSGSGYSRTNSYSSSDALEYKLGRMGVLETTIEFKYDSGRGRQTIGTGAKESSSIPYGRSKFQGGMSTFATKGYESDDYDDVD